MCQGAGPRRLNQQRAPASLRSPCRVPVGYRWKSATCSRSAARLLPEMLLRVASLRVQGLDGRVVRAQAAAREAAAAATALQQEEAAAQAAAARSAARLAELEAAKKAAAARRVNMPCDLLQ